MDAKALLKDLESVGFTPNLAKPEMGKELDGRHRARSYDHRAKGARVTSMGGRKASEKRSGKGENTRQPVMARLATW